MICFSYKFNDVDANSPDYWKGIETISENVTESITKYLLMGVSMSKYDGIGLCTDIASVTIFLNFFISMELPYSAKRKEQLLQDIVLFNFLKKPQQVVIKIKKDAKYTVGKDFADYGWQGKYSTRIL